MRCALTGLWVVWRLVFAVSLIGCGPTPAALEYVTDDLVFDSLDAGNRGAVSLVVGVVRDEVFVPLEDGQDLPILRGFQGGRWIHVALRVTGVRNRGRVQLEATGVGTAAYDIKLVRREGVLEVVDLPIPVGRQPALDDRQVDELAGRAVALKVSFTVGQVQMSQANDLVLSLAEQ